MCAQSDAPSRPLSGRWNETAQRKHLMDLVQSAPDMLVCVIDNEFEPTILLSITATSS